MNILVINAGSSSLKYQLFDMAQKTVLARGVCERIGIDGRIKHSKNGSPVVLDVTMPDHAAAIREVTRLLTDAAHGVIADMNEISAVGHRVVHGGEEFSSSVLITDAVLAAIERCVPLAPLHNPPNLVGIRACEQVMPGVPQVAVFDTAFHQTMPPRSFLYAIPYEYYENDKIRRYGFHGTSHRYVAERAAALLGKPLESLKIITCHLGNGSSVTAVDGGKSVDTSMGFTPLEGLPMGTRSGNIDPAIIGFLAENKGMTVSEVMDVLNKKSGMLGLSGVSSDFRDLDDAVAQGNPRAKVALDIFAFSVKKYIGKLAACMGGVDAVVFTAGIGENNAVMREWIMDGLGFMSLSMDREKNRTVRGVEADVSANGSRARVLVIPTNEELVIATDTEALIKGM